MNKTNLPVLSYQPHLGSNSQVSVRNIYEEMKRKNSIWVRGMIAKLNFKDQHEYQNS